MRVLLLLIPVLAVVGCESLSQRVSERFSRPEPHERVFEAPEPEVFVAAQKAMERLGYRITRAGEAQGLIEGQTRRLPTGQFGSSQQYDMRVELSPADANRTTVAALLRGQREGDFSAGASGGTIRAPGPYDLFFDTLEQVLSGDG